MTSFHMRAGMEASPGALEETAGWSGDVPAAAAALADASSVDLAGCGTSYFAGMAIAHVLQEVGIPAQAHNAFELAAYPPPADPRRALVAISHTGTTPDAVAAARDRSAPTIGLTDAADSPLVRACDHALIGPGGMEPALPKTRSYLTTLQRGYTLALAAGAAHGAATAELDDALRGAPEVAATSLAAEGIDALAQRFSRAGRIVVVGAGPEVATANEAALKITEAAGMHADAWEVEEAAHGTWASAEPDELAVLLAPRGRGAEAIRRIGRGLRAIGVATWVLGTDPEALAEADHATALPELPEPLAPLASPLPLYRFAFELALARGANPDVMRQDEPRHREARTIMRRSLPADV